MILVSSVKRYLKSRREGESGSIAIESVFMIPLLIWALVATSVYFQAFQAKSLANKATTTVADVFSREIFVISDDYMSGARELLSALVGENPDTILRVSVIERTNDAAGFSVVWSEVAGPGQVVVNNANLVDVTGRLPIMAVGDRIILVNTWVPYVVPISRIFFNILEDYTMENTMVTSPRFATTLCFNADGNPSTGTTLC